MICPIVGARDPAAPLALDLAIAHMACGVKPVSVEPRQAAGRLLDGYPWRPTTRIPSPIPAMPWLGVTAWIADVLAPG